MSLLSWFAKKKKTPNPPELTDHDVVRGVDVLETDLAGPNIEPEKCVVSKTSVFRPMREPTTITLVKGSSDSKPATQPTTENQQRQRTAPVRTDIHVNINHGQGITTTTVPHLQRSAIVPSRNKSTNLYPRLDSIGNERQSSSSPKRQVGVKKPESIHDIAGEITCLIQPKILKANAINNRLGSLRNDAQLVVMAVRSLTMKISPIEYNFVTEMDVTKNYSHVKVYKKLQSFDDVKKSRRRLNKSGRTRKSEDLKAAPIFQSYRSKLRCYKGLKTDVIDCD